MICKTYGKALINVIDIKPIVIIEVILDIILIYSWVFATD